jgi:hypothetical protein
MCYRSWIRCILTEINRLSGLSANSFFLQNDLFNAYLKNNDGLLANHIAQAEDLLWLCCKRYSVWSIELEKALEANGNFS